MVLTNVTVDNRNQTFIKYQGYWTTNGAYNATSVNETGTLSVTNDQNANFTIDTPLIAAFYYFGIKRSRGGFYQICIDCYPDKPQWQDIDGLNSTDDGQNPPVVLFSTSWTSLGSHEIIVTNRPDIRFSNNSNNSQITISKVVYTIDDGSTAPSTTSTAITSSASASSASASALPSSNSNRTLVAAVASSVSIVGSILILCIIFLLIRRRRKQAAQASWNANGTMTQTYTRNVTSEVDPFPPFSSPPVSLEKPSRYGGLSSVDRSLDRQEHSSVATNDPARSLFHGQPFTLQSTATVPQNTYIESTPRREEDAGSIHGLSDFGETLPPDYEMATRRRMIRQAL